MIITISMVTTMIITMITMITMIITISMVTNCHHFSHRLLSPPVLLTALGAIVFSVSFFGCCGAIKESHVLTR